jgi:hypothetical protein
MRYKQGHRDKNELPKGKKKLASNKKLRNFRIHRGFGRQKKLQKLDERYKRIKE